MRRLAIVVIIVALVSALMVFGISRDPNTRDDIDSPLLGREMPTFSMPLFERYQVEYSSSLAFEGDPGRPVVLNFWASWCAPCRDEAPMLEAAWREYGDRVLVVGVNTQDRSADNAEAFLDEFQLSFPNGRDANSRISIDYGIFGLPETFFIRADGTLSHKHAGPLSTEVLDIQIQALLN